MLSLNVGFMAKVFVISWKRTTMKYHEVLNGGRSWLPTLCTATAICGTYYIRDLQHWKHV